MNLTPFEASKPRLSSFGLSQGHGGMTWLKAKPEEWLIDWGKTQIPRKSDTEQPYTWEG